ncbi:MAG: hypothetical protein K0Q73_4037 [Paenibacillus sp.]|jgi:hypothetical protein|nr:hypothetical protein [Paenibacillus sp.]
MAKKSEEKKKMKWYEMHEEIPGLVIRGEEKNISMFTFGPHEWQMDYVQLLHMAGNQKFVDDVRAELEIKEGATGEVKARTWKQVKVLRIPSSTMEQKEKICVVLDSGAHVTQVLGLIGGDWAHKQTMDKHTLQIMSEFL